jgi:DNA gyrase subunit A
VLTVTENGYGKRTDIDEYRVQNRGGKGLINIKTSGATAGGGREVPAGRRRRDAHHRKGMIIRLEHADISTIGGTPRACADPARGGDHLVSVARLARRKTAEEPGSSRAELREARR